MKYICIEKPGKVSFREMDIPEAGEGEALLKLLYGGICGSDLGTYRGTFAYTGYPRIPGHEFSAEIVQVGKNPYGFEEGMVVTANPYFNCGECYSCQRGYVNCCEHNETMGAQRDGAFCQYITMPVERLFKSEGLSPKHLALVEPFCIGYHGIRRAEREKDDRVLVIGAGTIGVVAAISAQKAGARVDICDVAEGKLEYARRFGFDGYIKNDEDFLEQVNRRTGGQGYDVTVEAVGLPRTFLDAVDAAAYEGRMVQLGVGKKEAQFDFTLLQKKELKVLGSRNALSSDFSQVIELFGKGDIPLDDIITNVYPFEDGAKAFEEFDRNSTQMLKVMIEF